MQFFKNIILNEQTIGDINSLTKNPIHLAFGIDANFTIGAGVLIYSILQHTKRTIVCHIFTDTIKEEDINRFKQLYKQYNNICIKIYYINTKNFDLLPTAYIWSKAMYYRFLISTYLSTTIDTILYLDSDILCLNNFDSLFDININKYIAGVVPDNSYMINYAKKAFDFDNSYYFNSGFMLINLKKWHEEHISTKAIDLLTKQSFKYFDQDVLNILLTNKTLQLSKKYNTIYRLADMKNNIDDNTIFLHYTGSTKPWQAWGQYHFLTPLWLKYKNTSPWRNVPISIPQTYKQAKFMAKNLRRHHHILSSYKWYLIYSLLKLKYKLIK